MLCIEKGEVMKRAFLLLFVLCWISANAQWEQTNGPYGSRQILAIAGTGNDTIYVSSIYSGVFRSDDNGITWNDVSAGLSSLNVQDILVLPSGIVYAADSGISRSYNHGITWENADSGIVDPTVGSLAVNSRGQLFAAVYSTNNTQQTGVYRSDNNGDSWTLVLPLNGNTEVATLSINKKDQIFFGATSAIWRSDDNGNNWIPVNLPTLNYHNVTSIEFDKTGVVYAGTVYFGGLYRSFDDGANWELLIDQSDNAKIYSININHRKDIFIGDFNAISRSLDKGKTWETVAVLSPNAIVKSIWMDHHLLLAGENMIYRSSDNGSTWLRSIEGMIASSVNSIAVSPEGNVLASTGSDLWRSENNGDSWEEISDNVLASSFEKIKSYSSGLYVVGNNPGMRGLYRSVDEGVNWTELVNNNDGINIEDYAVNLQDNIFIITYFDGVWRSIDNGSTWQQLGLTVDGMRQLVINNAGTILVYSWLEDELYRSTDNGMNWEIASMPEMIVGMTADSLNNFYLINSSIWRSTDDGITWNEIPLNTVAGNPNTIWVSPGGYLFVSTQNGIFRSSDMGDTWIDYSSETLHPTANLISLAANKSVPFIFGGHWSSGVWRIATNLNTPKSIAVNDNLSVFPNPAHDYVNVVFIGNDPQKDRNLKLYNSTGQLIFTATIRSKETIIPLKGIHPGLYFIKADIESKLSKLIIQ
jgi:photosystem II stability/assembly factor-like uncharacterized protein